MVKLADVLRVHLSAQCIHAVTNITVDGLASETDVYSAVGEIPHIYGNRPLQDTSHSVVTLFLVSNFLQFPVVHKVVIDAGGKLRLRISLHKNTLYPPFRNSV